VKHTRGQNVELFDVKAGVIHVTWRCVL